MNELSNEINWPEEDSHLPKTDHTRLFYPDMVFESTYPYEIIEKKCSIHPLECGPYSGYFISRVDVFQFPHSENKKPEQYFFQSEMNGRWYTEMLDLSAIMKFRNEDNSKIFWLVPCANKKFESNGYQLYSNSDVPDLSATQSFVGTLGMIARSMQKEVVL